MAAVAGLRGTGDWATDERPKNFREYILFRNPNGSAPLTALMSKTASESVDDPEFNWWDEPNDIVRLQASGAHAAGVTTITVDSADPSTSAPGNVWGTAQHLVPGDILMVEKDTATYDNEILRVEQVLSATQFVVTRGFAGTTPATIANDAFILKIGSAYSEGSPSPSATSRNPIKYFNYCQIFKTAYELTETAKLTRTRTGDPLKNDKKRRMHDHKAALEQALMWGVKSETTNTTNGKPLRTMGGLRSFIPAATTTVFGAAVTTSSFLDAVYKVFDFDTEAGDERIVFCGNIFLNELNKIAAAAGDVNFTEVVKVYGVNLRQYVIPQGTLYLRTHPLLNRNSLFSKSAFIIDFSALRWRYLRDTKSMDHIEDNDEDTHKGQWLTEAGLEVRYGGLTCGYLGNMSAT